MKIIIIAILVIVVLCIIGKSGTQNKVETVGILNEKNQVDNILNGIYGTYLEMKEKELKKVCFQLSYIRHPAV